MHREMILILQIIPKEYLPWDDETIQKVLHAKTKLVDLSEMASLCYLFHRLEQLQYDTFSYRVYYKRFQALFIKVDSSVEELYFQDLFDGDLTPEVKEHYDRFFTAMTFLAGGTRQAYNELLGTRKWEV